MNDIVRPSALSTERTNPVASEEMVVDNGVTVARAKIVNIINAGRPLASQGEAEAGENPEKSMAPLTTKQAIAAQVPAIVSSAIAGLNLGTMSQQSANDYTKTGDLAAVARTNEYGDLDGLPALGTAAATATTDYATAAQGLLADTAIQPSDLATVAASGDYEDLSNKPTVRMLPSGGTASQVLIKSSDSDYDAEWATSAAATAVSYASQTLTTGQMSQARTNIGAAASNDPTFSGKVKISSDGSAVENNLAILSVNNFNDNTCGLRVRSYWSGTAAAPYNNNDCSLFEVYNSTPSNSLNRSWAVSAANAYHNIPAGVTDTGTRVGVLGWATSVSIPGYQHNGTLSEQVGLYGRAGFQSPGSGASAVISEAVAVRGEIVTDSAGSNISNAMAGQFVTRANAGNITRNTAVYASARGGGQNFSFFGDGGILQNADDAAVGDAIPSASSGNTTPGIRLVKSGQMFSSRVGSDAKLSLQTLSGSGSAVLAAFLWGSEVTGTIGQTSTTTSYATSSDYRLGWKEGKTEVADPGAFIDALQPYHFPKAGKSGFIAHEFGAISPTSVIGEKDAVDENGEPIFQQMQASSDDVMANIIAELQSLRRRVAELEGAA